MSDVRIVQSVQRAINIINCFDEGNYFLSLNEISDRLSLNINTVRGLVQTLVFNDLLIHDKEKNLYHLGYYFNAKSKLITEHFSSILVVARPYLHEIAHHFMVTSSLQIVQGDSIQTVCFESPNDSQYRIVGVQYHPLPHYATASGKLLLAFSLLPTYPNYIDKVKFNGFTEKTIISPSALLTEMEKVRQQGYATENDEFETSIYSVAVPLFNFNQKLVASISLVGITSELCPKEEDLVRHLMVAKTEIERKTNGVT